MVIFSGDLIGSHGELLGWLARLYLLSWVVVKGLFDSLNGTFVLCFFPVDVLIENITNIKKSLSLKKVMADQGLH